MDYFKRVFNFKHNIPPNVVKALEQIGNKQISTARCGRTPVNSIVQGTLRTIANVPYDNLFHLFLELNVEGEKWIIEKIERITLVKEDRSQKQGAEFTASFPVNKTVNELFINTQKFMGNRFLPYQSNSNNCQVFIMGVLQGNGLSNQELTNFVKQDTRSIFKNSPYLRKFANTLTDLGGYFNAAFQGGKLKIGGNNVTTSDDIDKMCSNIRNYRGCFTVDELKKSLDSDSESDSDSDSEQLQNGFYVINLNGTSHWTMLCKDKGKFYYYDSFGFPPPQKLEDMIKDYYWNDRENQDLNQTSCGYYCVACIQYLNKRTDKRKALDEFVSIFNKDTKQNDMILKTMLQHL
jgi:hypothetical protein